MARPIAEIVDATRDRRVFDVIRYALDDLQRVEGLAVRNLGYAFHSLPELHEPFDHAFSLRFVAALTELKLALSRLVDEQPADLEARVKAPGFARSM